VSTLADEVSAMSDQMYEHMAKWRRTIHDMIIQVGIKEFSEISSVHDNKSPDRAPDADQAQKPTRDETKTDSRQESER